MMPIAYVEQKLWNDRQAEWSRRERRGDFIVYDSPADASDASRPNKKRQPIPSDILPSSYRD